MSRTVTVVDATALLPWPSLAKKLTIVVPGANTAGALLVTIASPVSLEAVAIGRETGAPERSTCSTVTGAGMLVK